MTCPGGAHPVLRRVDDELGLMQNDPASPSGASAPLIAWHYECDTCGDSVPRMLTPGTIGHLLAGVGDALEHARYTLNQAKENREHPEP